MIKFILIAASIGFLAAQELQIQDLCNANVCWSSSFKDHITCGFTGSKSASCSDDSVVPLGFGDDVKQKIVDTHNKLRNKIANGEQPGFKSAAKMPTLRWSDELAGYAALNAMRCQVQHDCHNTKEMQYAGQNIYGAGDYDNDLVAQAEAAVNSWYDEYKKATMADIDNCCTRLKQTGHFTQVVSDGADRVGCAFGYFRDENNQKITYVVCNYSFGNLTGTKNYVSGAPASKCKTGNNPKYPALCSESEVVDANNKSD